jgi:hypothetical protein
MIRIHAKLVKEQKATSQILALHSISTFNLYYYERRKLASPLLNKAPRGPNGTGEQNKT